MLAAPEVATPAIAASPVASAATRERGAKLAEELTRRWIHAYGEQVSEIAWRADLWGRRILFWTAYAPYLLSSRDLVYRSQLLHALGRNLANSSEWPIRPSADAIRRAEEKSAVAQPSMPPIQRYLSSV